MERQKMERSIFLLIFFFFLATNLFIRITSLKYAKMERKIENQTQRNTDLQRSNEDEQSNYTFLLFFSN